MPWGHCVLGHWLVRSWRALQVGRAAPQQQQSPGTDPPLGPSVLGTFQASVSWHVGTQGAWGGLDLCTRIGTGTGGSLRGNWGRAGWPGTPTWPFLFVFFFIMEKGAYQISSPTLCDSLCCIVLFCFVNCTIFKYLSLKKKKKKKKYKKKSC